MKTKPPTTSHQLLATAAVGCLLLLTTCRHSTPTLGLLVWEGYADPSFIAGFEKTCQCKVGASYMGSSDELVAKLRGGSAANYDVISPSSDVASMISTQGLAAPKTRNEHEVRPERTRVPRAALAPPTPPGCRPAAAAAENHHVRLRLRHPGCTR